MQGMATIVMGRYFGQASGWDEYADSGVIFYDVVFVKMLDAFLPEGIESADLVIDFETGVMEIQESKGGPALFTGDAVQFLPLLPKTSA